MSTAVARTDYGLFFDDLCHANQRALLLDYDGTVAPFAVDRTRAFPYPTVPELLDCIMSTCRTRVVLISGRSAREIPDLLGLNPCPEVWGSNGIERLHSDGVYKIAHVRDADLHALSEADAWLEEAGLRGCVELKPGAVAVHWRSLPPAQVNEARTQAYRSLAPLAADAGLLLFEFDGGIELRSRTRDKGHAVRTILSELEPGSLRKGQPLAAIAYLGDDTCDEDAFTALDGAGLTVLVRPQYRPTRAHVWIRPPQGLIQFLSDWIRACGGDV